MCVLVRVVFCFAGARARRFFCGQMFTTDTQLRTEKADETLREIMTATVQDMFDEAAQVRGRVVAQANSHG